MSIVFYSAPMSSAAPVASALFELNIPHEKVSFDLKQGEHTKPEYLAINPNGKVPTLVVDGTPMFEALAIMMWLGDRYGVSQGLWPAENDPQRMQAYAWCVWSYVTYGTLIGRLHVACNPAVPAELHNAAQAKLIREQATELLDILEQRLSTQSHMLGDQYSLADLVVASVVGYGALIGFPVEAHPRVKQWLASFQSRPAYRAAMPAAA